MKDIHQACAKLNILSQKIENYLRLSNYYNYNDLSDFAVDHKDAEQFLLKEELQIIMDKLAEAQDRIKYLSSPVKEISRLHRNGSGRYETEQGHYYCCGSRIEALVPDSDTGVSRWVRTSVEHNREDYFLVGYDDVPLDGLTVRVRKEA